MSFIVISISMGEGGSMPELVLDKSVETVGGWEEDWDPMVPGLVETDTPCFILYRLDEKDSGGCYLWVLLSWSPDTSHTRSPGQNISVCFMKILLRQKMLYASTKATFKKQFGAGQIKDEYFANLKEEVSLAGYRKHLSLEAAPGPLSRQEEELKEIKENESRVEIGIDTKHNNMAQLSFPFHDSALTALHKYKQMNCDYVQLSIGN